MIKKLMLLLFIALCFNISARAQEDTSLTNSRIKLRKVIKEKLMDKLNIDEATANKFIKLFNEQKRTIGDYNKEKRQLFKSIEENPNASDVTTKINTMLDIDDKINKSRRDFITEIGKILTPQQIAQSLVFQKNLRKYFMKEQGK
jgi:Spy/CpxP family protein refolding chaperone